MLTVLLATHLIAQWAPQTRRKYNTCSCSLQVMAKKREKSVLVWSSENTVDIAISLLFRTKLYAAAVGNHQPYVIFLGRDYFLQCLAETSLIFSSMQNMQLLSFLCHNLTLNKVLIYNINKNNATSKTSCLILWLFMGYPLNWYITVFIALMLQNCLMTMNDIHLNSVLLYEYITISSSETSTSLMFWLLSPIWYRDVE